MAKMERTLTQRFTRIAKSFGKGLGNAVKGGAIGAVALGLIDKLLNPLKEVQEAIERTLSYSDDLVTNANQFSTSAGNLAKLQAYGQSAGLDASSLNMLLTKYQTAIAEAAADPNAKSAVRAYAGDKDIAASFFQFIQELQKMNKNDQVLVQKEVFGEKQILKMSDFLNSDFASVAKYFKGISNEKLTAAATKTGGLNDLKDTLEAAMNLKDIEAKSKLINTGTISTMQSAKQIALQKENDRIANFQTLANVNNKINEIAKNIEDLAMSLLTELPIVMKAFTGIVDLLRLSVQGWADLFKLLGNSKLFKYFTGGSKGE